MDKETLKGLARVNGHDLWTEYGAFLGEERRGGMDNLTSLLTPSRGKTDVAVSLREEDGERYSAVLTPRNEARDVELTLAVTAETQTGWIDRYTRLMRALKQGVDGWVTLELPTLGMELRLKYVATVRFTPLTYLWREGLHAGRVTVKLREPKPTL